MRRRAVLALAAVAAVAGAAAAVVVLLPGPSPGHNRAALLPAGDLARCRGLGGELGRACYARVFSAAVAGRDDPRPAVAAIARAASRESAFLVSNCHGVMHSVGRAYAREAHVTLATLMDYLPASNDPGCSAGFAHGLVTAVAPDIDPSKPREAAAVCADARTRYQRYSCVHGFGHAFMRLYGDQLEPALELCRGLGARAAPDCAQGAYHDYWFAVAGADDANAPPGAVTDPFRLCAAQPAAFVRPCWYRAFIDNRPEGFSLESPRDLEDLCAGLRGLQRSGCLTAGAVIGPADPVAQLDICGALRAPADAASCARGTKVANLPGRGDEVALIRRCARFAAGARGACYRWLGRTLAVVTDGAFGRDGCPQLAAAAARQCRAGAERIDDPLATFS